MLFLSLIVKLQHFPPDNIDNRINILDAILNKLNHQSCKLMQIGNTHKNLIYIPL